jgi:uncharacterized protein
MNTDQGWLLRLATLSTLVKRSPQRPGRTALMKYAYLLQTVKEVPLGYHFELYNYGPYDSSVLSDLSQAETLKAIKSRIVNYPAGSGYEYSANDNGCEALCSRVADEMALHEASIRWVLDEFGREPASQMELISTIVFAEREMHRKRQPPLSTELCRRVKGIKPHFSDSKISATVDELSRRRLISIAAA